MPLRVFFLSGSVWLADFALCGTQRALQDTLLRRNFMNQSGL